MFEITLHEVKLKKKLTELSLKHCLRFKIRNKAVDMNGLWLTVPLLIRGNGWNGTARGLFLPVGANG